LPSFIRLASDRSPHKVRTESTGDLNRDKPKTRIDVGSAVHPMRIARQHGSLVVPHVTLISPLDRNSHGGGSASMGIRTTATAIASDHVRRAFLGRAIAAIPTRITHAEINNRAPRCVVGRMPGGRTDHRACRQAGDGTHKFARGSHYFAFPLALRFCVVLGVVFGVVLGGAVVGAASEAGADTGAGAA
jgi:hypothetical protein